MSSTRSPSEHTAGQAERTREYDFHIRVLVDNDIARFGLPDPAGKRV